MNKKKTIHEKKNDKKNHQNGIAFAFLVCSTLSEETTSRENKTEATNFYVCFIIQLCGFDHFIFIPLWWSSKKERKKNENYNTFIISHNVTCGRIWDIVTDNHCACSMLSVWPTCPRPSDNGGDDMWKCCVGMMIMIDIRYIHTLFPK